MSIYEQKHKGEPTGRYRVEVQVGSRRKRATVSSLADARRVEKDFLAELKGQPVSVRPEPKEAPCLPTLQDGLTRAKGHLWFGDSTEAASLRKLERIIRIWGQDTPIDAVNADKMDQLIVTLRTEGRKGTRIGTLSEATINRYLSCVSAFLNFCESRELRTKPIPKIEWNDEDEGRIRWISYEEEARLMELLPKPYDTLVYIAIRTGLRISELLGLQEEQLEKEWVHLWGTGTKSGKNRSVPLSPNVYAALRPLVSQKTMPDYWAVRVQWDKAREKMGLSSDPTFVFHACRHSYATRAVQAGVNIRVLQEIMGHATIKTTLRYAHVDDQTKKDAALKALAFHDDRMTVVAPSRAA